MAKASDNDFPKIVLVEQASPPDTPAAGSQKIFIDDSDHHLKRIDESDVIVDLEETAASVVDDTAYNATTWNGDTTHAPSKNAVRDKIESMSSGGSASLVSDKKTLTSGDKTITGAGSNAFADIDAGLSITLTTGARRCLVVFNGVGKNSSSGQTQVDLNIDGSRVGQTFGLSFAGGTAGVNNNLSFSFITDVLTAGSHTFKPQWRIDNTSHTGTLYASTSISPLVFAVYELPLKDPT